MLGLATFALASVAASGSQASVRRLSRTASDRLFSVRFQGKWTDTWKQVDVGPKDPEPECDTETGSGTFTSTLEPSRTLLAIGPDGRDLDCLWGVSAKGNAIYGRKTPIAFAMKAQELDDATCHGGTVMDLELYGPGCGSWTRKGQVSFITPGGGGAVSPTTRALKLQFGWEMAPGFDGIGCSMGNFLYGKQLTPFQLTAQKIDYRKLYRCKGSKAKCTVTLHAAKSFSVHSQSKDNGRTSTYDDQGHLGWTVTVTPGGTAG